MISTDTVRELSLWFKNTECLWARAEWCAQAINKKVKKTAMTPSLEHLANSSTVKTIVRETHKNYCKTFGEFPLNTDTRRALHIEVAQYILEYANDLFEYEKHTQKTNDLINKADEIIAKYA